MKQNKKNKTNFYTFIIAAILVVASLSFFSSAEEGGEMGESIFEDFDGDGLSNSEEESFGTDINNRDSDGDGYSDGVEIESGYDPLIPAPGDRIAQEDEQNIEIDTLVIDDQNLTQKLSKELVEYIADTKESGKEEISTEDISELVSESIEEAVSFEDIEIDALEFDIKKQDYSKLSEQKKKDKEKADVVEYFTSVSYVFMTNFPEGFFERPVEEFAAEVLQNSKSFSTNLAGTDFFEELAEHAVAAEEEMKNIEVPESLVEIHFQGLYILRYVKSIYSGKEYESVEDDAMSMMVTLTKLQGLLDLSNNFIENVNLIMAEYEIDESFLNL